MDRILLICVCFSTLIYINNGCLMEGVTQWLAPQHLTIKDTHRGIMVNRTTTEIEDINRIDYGDGLYGGPYLEILHQNSVFTVTTSDAFAQYEEYETLLSIRVTITFSCTGGSTRPLTFVFNIDDTNNHAPVFLPSDNYNFPLALPVPPGFNVTGCEYLIVRDVDLTTKRIEFWIEDNPYFEILYSRQTQPKEFGGFIRTKSVIRSTPDFLSYRISATDVDDTGDEPLTSFATVNILADNEFRLPDEPIFSEAFYKADYTKDHELVLRSDIRLRQGYDDQVKFSHEGAYADNFELVVNENKVSFRLKSPLPSDITTAQIFLVVKAEREFTSGSKATVVVFLPEVLDVRFESSLYEGQIEDNVLRAPNIILTQGHENIVDIEIISEHASFFSAVRSENTITLSMSPLPIAVIQSNNILSLQVVASANRSSDTTAVALEIIKDDYITPVFEKDIYIGNYDSETGLSLDPIVLTQGFDSTVVVTLSGEHASYFQKAQQGAVINLSASIPAELWPKGSLLITVAASKPRTVGANTAVRVNLPEARELIFEAPSYSGSIENNVLTIPNIVLSYGYADDVIFELSGQFSSYFNTTNSQNHVTISLRSNLPDNIILENSALMLILTASGLNAVRATTNILLDIIKNDHITPVFERSLYNGSYDSVAGLALENLVIVQGFDHTVELSLDGDHANLFQIKQEGQIIALNGSVPPNIWPEQILLLTLRATKPRTVGANTAIQISLPAAREMKFQASEYIGYIENNTLNIEEIILSVGYSMDVEFELIGEFARYFNIFNNENRVSITLNEPLSENTILENNFIVLTIRAEGLNAISTATTILLEIIKEDTNTPVFSQNIYRGFYKDPSNVDIEDISLIQGFDSSVTFRLQGDNAQYFEMTNSNNDVKILVKSQIPEELIFDQKVLLFKVLAEKDRTVGASATVSIEFPRELTEPTIMKFSKNIYFGSIMDEIFKVDTIILDTGYRNGTSFILSGDYAELFELSISNNNVTIGIKNSISAEQIEKHKYIILEIQASRDRAVSVSAAIIIDLVTPDPIVFPVFDRSFYNGSYTKDHGLQFDQDISLIAGFDATVTFGLEGDYSKWFSLQANGNSVSIILNPSQEIPNDVIDSNYHVLFTIVANKPGTIGGRSAISIVLPKDFPTSRPLRFESDYYKGTIEEDVLSLDEIVLQEGYSKEISFHLNGDYIEYFQLSNIDGNITLRLERNLPSDIYEKYSFLLFVLEARMGNIRTHTTIILEIKPQHHGHAPVLKFEETYYTGAYSEADGLVFPSVMSLVNGPDEQIEFSLQGDHSEWFGLERQTNSSISLILLSRIPSVVLANNRKLIFVVQAMRPGSVTARATIVIALSDDDRPESILRFEQNSYSGFIENNTLNLEPIVLNEGFTPFVSFNLLGDLASFFDINVVGPRVEINLKNNISEDSIPANRLILLELQATAPQAVPAFTTIVLTVKSDNNIEPVEQPSFTATYYTGQYTERDGLIFERPFSLSQGYSENIVFALEGDNSVWFGLERRSENSLDLVLRNPIPPAVLANNRKLIFTITATHPDRITARATIIIALTDEYTSDTILGFERVSYSGFLRNNTLNLGAIILTEGSSSQVSFALQGDLARFFTFTTDGRIVRINLLTAIPESSIPSNRIILLELRASAPQAVPAFATIVLSVESENIVPPIEQPSFAETYYTGRYNEQYGLTFEQLFSLSKGYDENVVFALEGDNSVWFGLEKRSENSLTLTLRTPIPPAVIANNQKLIFVITATRSDSFTARATVIISLTDEYTPDAILGFEQVSYSGSLRNNTLNLEPIILIEGFSPQVSFALQGDLSSYFNLATDGQIVRINLLTAIPEDSIPLNRIILLEIRASAPQALPASAAIVLAVESENIIPPVEHLSFVEAFYTGRYTEQDGLKFDGLFSLLRGYDENVGFALEGDNSVWFGLERRSENSLALILRTAIPPAVLANNRKLIFTITATRPGSITARATIIIALMDEYTHDTILGFERVSYSGSLRNGTLNLEPIILTQGFNPQVAFSLQGDLASHFSFATDGQIVRLNLLFAIPEDSIPTNHIILLELRASAQQAVPATATIVLAIESENIVLPVEQPSFADAYYTGRYTEQDGLTFNEIFSLSRGYDENIVFLLEGEHSVWFGLEKQSENSLTLMLRNPIPPAVLANNRKLIFVITATRPDGMTARATVIISLTDEYTADSILGFEQISYSGSLTNNTLSLDPIILIEGFSPQVSFALQGDLASYFNLAADGRIVRIQLVTAIPENSLPINRIILLEIRASAPQTVPASATIVLAVESKTIIPPVEQPSFVEAYYTGRYTEQDGLTFDGLFSLSRGYDENVVFALEGDTSVWFGLEKQSENSLALILRTPIPPAVLINNRKLIFIITATRPGSITARATIVIALIDEYTPDAVLGFERVSYSGSLANSTLNLEPIVLSQGFSPQVVFSLQGDLASFFTLAMDGQTVQLNLPSAIPEESIPTNRIILLELRATAPQAMSATATIVLAVETENIVSPIEQPAFMETYYTGRYTEQDGLIFDGLFSLSRGYDQNIVFALEGDNSAWFGLERRSENSHALILRTPIPPAVLANNRKLIFVITAIRPDSMTARATVVISLTDEYTADSILGFEQISYSGSLTNNTLSLEPIILIEGFSPQVSFALQGDLASYFNLATDGRIVRIQLVTAIPDNSIPINRIILLEIRASAPQTVPAFATIVLAVETENIIPPVEQPSFVEAYYTGRYTEQDGLTFDGLFSLSRGYDESVVFALEGDNSVWFGLERRSENSHALILRTPIPPAVLANNRKLIFVITATRLDGMTARATVVISLTDEYTADSILGFEQISYSGSLTNNSLSLDPIILIEGFSPQVSFALQGDLSSYFNLAVDGRIVRIQLVTAIPENSIPINRIILLEIRASAPQTVPASATIVLAVDTDNVIPPVEQPSFVEAYYTGRYTEQDGLTFDGLFSLSRGYDESVVFALEGDNSVWFGLERQSENSLALILRTPIPPAVLANNRKLIFIITATRPGSIIARATIVVALIDEYTPDAVLGFERVSYSGTLTNSTLNLEPIILSQGFSPQVAFSLQGDLASYFTFATDGRTVQLNLPSAIPEESIPTNRIILLELRATAPQVMSATATIVLAVKTENIVSPIEQPSFVEAYYTGRYTEQDGLTFDGLFSLSRGYDESVVFALEGDNSVWFGLQRQSENSLALILRTPIPPAVLANNRKLIFIITATRPDSITARATIVIALIDEYTTDTVLGFERVSYSGSLSNSTLNLEPIILTQGFSPQVAFSLQGDLASYFTIASDGQTVRLYVLSAIPEDSIPTNSIILLELRASAPQTLPATATIVLAVQSENVPPPVEQPSFANTYYTGRYTEQDGLVLDQLISLASGYDDRVVFALEGDNSEWFGVEKRSSNSIDIILTSPIPPAIIANNLKIVFVVTASRPGSEVARATIIIVFSNDSDDINVAFDNILYHGFIRLTTVTHEPITITGYNGSNIEISGQYAELFEASLLGQDVVVKARSAVLPNVSYIALELQAGAARAVLVLNVLESESPELPTVTFDSSSYVLKVTEIQTGVIGRVRATSDNGETIIYSLVTNDEYLRARLSVSNDGELRLSAPATTGAHSVQVVATTLITGVAANAIVHLTVEAVVNDRGIVVPPLIILDKDEEEPHRNLVVLNQIDHQGCRYILSNIWPVNQTWLYVDEFGLHAQAIDREHESIAFMTLSQIQVELVLSCANDNTKIRTKRSLSSKSKVDWLGPYGYGSSKWILTDSIPYNARRSLVNLIVNDINDNAPIFVGKQNEPIAVGYPVSSLEEIILPRSLAELKATDADIGENAALVYWTAEESIAVSPTTGFVHVRDNSNLENNSRLIIQATDRKGAGLTGNLELVVKLLEKNHIAVVTIRNAFLDNEEQILIDLSSAVGYEIKTLRTIVISESESSRNKRETTEGSGASLQLFVYGLIEREPVQVNKLTADIINSNIVTVNVVGSVSLEDHLGNETCPLPGRDTGLLVATIVLSILLFILIAAIVAWILKRKLGKNYESFSDKNSLASGSESPEPKPEFVSKPRLNIEDLKRSEKRLQERLQVPIVNVSDEPSTSEEKLQEAIINISTPEPNLPIVIQTIDKLKDSTEESEDDDEFGEGKKSKRKSVVTFNENVEKIIHLEDSSDISPDSDYEIYKL